MVTEGKLRGPRRGGWTRTKLDRFLAELEISCNVRLASSEAGISKFALYQRRRLDPEFAEAWSAALDRGCERIRGELISRAIDTDKDDLEGVGRPGLPPMTDEMRLRVLQVCRGIATASRSKQTLAKQTQAKRTADEVLESLLKKLDRLEVALSRESSAGG